MSLMDMLLQAAAGSTTKPDEHYEQIAQQAPSDLLGHGLSEAFRSDQTPPFPQMVGQLFGQSNSMQQAGVLNQLLSAIGPMAIAGLAGGALSKVIGPTAGTAVQITPEQAARLTPEQVQQIASHAEQSNPGIVDKLGGFYAEHPTLVKTLGSFALMLAMSKMKDKLTQN